MSFQEFVENYFGFPIDLCDLSDEDEMLLTEMYEESKKEECI